jgi:hypothetical protein
VELSENVPVAVNCSVLPFTIDGFAGVTAIDTSAGPLTVRVVVPLTPPEAACIWLVPAATPVANPPAVIVATPELCDVHVTEPLKFCVELSEKVPVAVNCSVLPFAIDGFAGVTAIDTSVAELTVSTVDPLTLPEIAMIVLDPAAFAVAIPPGAIVAAFVFWDCQLTEPLRSFVEPSLYFPVAVNGSVVPVAIVGFIGVTEIELRVGKLEGGAPAQLDNKTRAQRENRTEVHRKPKCRRPSM